MIVPNGGPKLRLVEAAERLFAENGFEVVSVRDITQAAGGNVAAVNYHFGSRDGLVEVVMTRYITPVNEERLARLDAAEQKWADQAVPIEEVVDAFVRPLITQVEKSELSEQLFYRLVGRIFGSHGNAIPAGIEAQISVLIGRFTQALGRSLPTLAQEDLVWRMHFVVGAMIHMLTHGESLMRLSHGTAGTPTMEATLERFLRFAVAGLRHGVMSQQADPAVVSGHSDDGHRPPPPSDGGSNIDSGGAVLPGDHDAGGKGEAVPKPGKKRTRKVEQDSPQVMFEF